MGAPDISGNDAIRLAAALKAALRRSSLNQEFLRIDLAQQAPATSAGLAAACWLRPAESMEPGRAIEGYRIVAQS